MIYFFKMIYFVSSGCKTLEISVDQGAQFTKYLTMYRKIIVRSTYNSDLKSAKISFRNIIS